MGPEEYNDPHAVDGFPNSGRHRLGTVLAEGNIEEVEEPIAGAGSRLFDSTLYSSNLRCDRPRSALNWLANKRRNMAARPDFGPDEVLSRERLMEVRQNFARLSIPSLQQAYAEALERCKLDRRGRAPASIHIQVLVQAWKQLRKGTA